MEKQPNTAAPVKTLQECKDEIAQIKGFKDWDDYLVIQVNFLLKRA